MKFDTYFRITSYALIASAFLAMAMTGEVDALSVILYSAAFFAAFYLDTKGVKKWRPREWAWRLLTALYIPFMLVDSAIFSNRILALVHLSLFASAVKLFQDKVDRDWVFLYLIAFFQMLLASGLTFNATFVGSLIAFVFFFISTLAAFEIRRTRRHIEEGKDETIIRLKPKPVKSSAKASLGANQNLRTGRVRYLLSASVLQIIIVSALAFPLFFMIPRFNSASLASNLGEGETLTGFSNTVELGKIAEIKENHRVVMRVKLNKRPGRFIRWRGIALENYNGKAWSLVQTGDRYRSSYQGQNSEDKQEDADFERAHRFDTPIFEQPLREENLEQRIILEPLSTNTLFAAHGAKGIRGRTAYVLQDRYSGALSTTGIRGRFQYLVSSNISVPNDDELRADNSSEYPGEIERFYLQKPVSFDPRIRKLAQEVTGSARTNYDRALAIQNYLKTELHYTLNLKTGGADPLAEFLFDTKAGHCEYFATAMVMMLRSIGIPARIVNGFQMGEYNSLNDLYTVRESDAHSWVEVFFLHNEMAGSSTPNTFAQLAPTAARGTDLRGKGSWVEFDPTPSAGINDYSQGGLRASLRKYMDAMEVFWLDYVVTLDRDEQASMMVEIQHRLMQLKNSVLSYYQSVKVWFKNLLQYLAGTPQMNSLAMVKLSGLLVILLLALSAIFITVAYKRRRKMMPTGYNPWWYRWFIAPILRRVKFRKHDHRASVILFYEQMLAVAAKAGLVKTPDQTPMEFAVASGYAQIREITSLYNRVRFGQATLDEREVRRISDLLANLKQAIQRR